MSATAEQFSHLIYQGLVALKLPVKAVHVEALNLDYAICAKIEDPAGKVHTFWDTMKGWSVASMGEKELRNCVLRIQAEYERKTTAQPTGRQFDFE